MRKSRRAMVLRPPATTSDREGRVAAILGRWAVVALWAPLPFVAGPAFADALAITSRPVQIVASVGLWVAWAVALGAALVPRTVTLTVVRVIVPATVPALIWSAFLRAHTTTVFTSFPAQYVDGDPVPIEGTRAISLLVGVGLALLAAVVVLSAPVGDVFVNGSSYGDERRMLLRPGAAVLLGPLELAWAVCVAGTVAGPLLLAAQNWVLGAVAVVVGGAAVVVAARALHGLARRWVVFVPAGFVLHDLTTMAEPMLVPRKTIVRLGPAPADTQARDLTAGALGLALEVDLDQPTPINPAPGRRGSPPPAVDVDALLFSPSRPGALLREARRRRIPVG